MSEMDTEAPLSPENLPPIYKSELDEQGLTDLIADLGALAQVEVRLKFTARGYAPETTVSVEDAHAALVGKKVRGAQFMYTHDDKLWNDTVMCRGTGYLVVRMQQLVVPTR